MTNNILYTVSYPSYLTKLSLKEAQDEISKLDFMSRYLASNYNDINSTILLLFKDFHDYLQDCKDLYQFYFLIRSNSFRFPFVNEIEKALLKNSKKQKEFFNKNVSLFYSEVETFYTKSLYDKYINNGNKISEEEIQNVMDSIKIPVYKVVLEHMEKDKNYKPEDERLLQVPEPNDFNIYKFQKDTIKELVEETINRFKKHEQDIFFNECVIELELTKLNKK